MPKLGREDVVAGVDGILHVADEMGEADLIVHGCPAHLPAIAVRHPEIGPEVTKEIRHHFLGAGGCGDEKGAVVMMELESIDYEKVLWGNAGAGRWKRRAENGW